MIDVTEIARMAQRAMEPHQLEGGEPYTIVPMECEVKSLAHLLPPTRIQRTVKFTTAESFQIYVNRWKGQHSEGFCSLERTEVRAIIDAHEPPATPTRCEHVAIYTCPLSKEWEAWTGFDKQRMDQVRFAEFLEDHADDVVTPPGAELRDLALNLQIHRKAQFASAVKLESGELTFSYSENNEPGTVAIPATFELGIPVFRDGTTYKVVARLRYRLTEGQLALWYELVHPEKYVEDAFNESVEAIAESTTLTYLRIE